MLKEKKWPERLCFIIYRIGAHAFSLLEKKNIYSSGLILEAPFNKMSEAIRQYSTSKVTNAIIMPGYLSLESVDTF